MLALHNNSPSYSALDYLRKFSFSSSAGSFFLLISVSAGGVYAEDASEVHIGELFSPRDFYFISNGVVGVELYNCLTAEGLTAVLQVPYDTPNSTLTNDGSLSVYSAIQHKPYVNTEAAAAWGSEGTQ